MLLQSSGDIIRMFSTAMQISAFKHSQLSLFLIVTTYLLKIHFSYYVLIFFGFFNVADLQEGSLLNSIYASYVCRQS
jgi:hypothetical protein